MLKVAVFNLFGGTGKSTTALNLGAAIASPKRRVFRQLLKTPKNYVGAR